MTLQEFFNSKGDVEEYTNILNSKKISKSQITVWLQKQKNNDFDWESLLPKI